VRQAALAPAKLNLSLRVLAREGSGFHQIETLFCAIRLADQLDVDTECDGGIDLHVVPPADAVGPLPDLGPLEQNLAWRAAASFFEAAGIPPRVRIRLEKRIPAGAGLGGGSSDAATVLTTLNALHGAPLTEEELLAIGARLGSDVPFFISGAPLALAWGRGTRIMPLPPLPSRSLLLAVPDVAVNTAGAYGDLAALRGHGWVAPPRLLQPVSDWEALAAVAANDFEEIVFRQLPALGELRLALEDSGAIMARMTGTGSVLFGVYEDARVASSVRQELGRRFPAAHWVLTRT
jgi:4-diphosphocytidyl-2-C-methyl-D-erythritol kinase